MEKRITPYQTSNLTGPGPSSPQPNPQWPQNQQSPQSPQNWPNQPPSAPLQTPKSARWVRPVRLLLWLIVALALPIGLSLRARSQSSSAFSDGTTSALSAWGNCIFWPALVLGLANLIWGLTRWILRWRREHWRPSQVIGKLIGGGIWRTFAAAPFVLLSLFVFSPLVARAVSSSALDRTLPSSDALLTAAYSAGEIDADTYLTYLLDATYNSAALPAEYQSPDPFITPDFLSFIDAHFDKLSPELILSTLETVSLANLDFDTDASSNVSSSSSLFFQNAYANTKVTTLNKARLSSDKNFVVFYTDTGDDAISDQDAATVASMLESIIANYSSVLGFKYEYQLYSMSNSKTKKMSKVLEANGIDKDITNTAMAVYIADPYKGSSNILASYAGRRFSDNLTNIAIKLGSLFGEDTAQFYASTPAYPFINILPSNVSNNSLALVTAHELGHHYASNYCYSATGGMCNDNDFIDETAPNWFAINVVSDQPSGNLIQTDHHGTYIKYGVCYTIDQVVPDPPKEHACHSKGNMAGYPAVAFLQNYSEIVPDATNKILQALTSDNALQDLYNAAGQANFKKTMTSLTQRNLTNTYGSKLALYATDLPHGEEVPCTDLCTQTYYIAPASSRYLYFPTSDYKNVALSVAAPGQVTVSLLGRKHSVWSVLSSADNAAEFTIPEDAEYDTYAFALANYSITDSSDFSLEVTATPLEELVADDPLEFDPNGLPIILLSDNCLGFNFDNIIDFPLQVYRVLSQFDPDHDYSDLFAELEAENTQIKNSLTYHYATLCLTELKPGLDFATTRTSLRQSIGSNLEFFHVNDSDFRLSMLVTYNLFRLEGRFYFLMQVGDDTALITARMYEKAPVIEP